MVFQGSTDVSGHQSQATLPFEHTLAWRVLSFVLGVAAPALIWNWIAQREFGSPPDYAVPHSFAGHVVWRGSAILVALEIACMTVWLLRPPRSTSVRRVFAIIFWLGTLIAAGWSLFALDGLVLLLSQPERDMLWRSPIALVFAIPLTCVFVYAVHARVASISRARTG
jgi:hypothetical protein